MTIWGTIHYAHQKNLALPDNEYRWNENSVVGILGGMEYETEQRELAPDKSSGKRVQKVEIIFNFIGAVDFPNEPQSKPTTKEKTA